MPSITKGELVLQAYDMLAINGVTVGASHEDLSMGVKHLEMLIPSWERKGIKIGYIKAPSLLDIDLNDESGVIDTDLLAVSSNLAKLICSAFGKQCPPLIAEYASNTLRDLYPAPIQMMKNAMMPRGAGNNRNSIWTEKFSRVNEDVNIASLTNEMKEGEINDYTEGFYSYLHSLEDIETFTITADAGLNIELSSNTITKVSYRVKAITIEDDSDEAKTVKITITTTDGRVEIRNIKFTVIK